MRGFQFIARRRARHATVCGIITFVVAVCAHAYGSRHHRHSAPVISGTPAATDVAGQSYSFTPTASGPSGLSLKFAISGKPGWATFSTSSGQLTGTPTTSNVGTYSRIAITVTDGLASASLPSFAITVSAPAAPADIAPTISGTPAASLNVGATYSFTPTAADANGDKLTFSIQNKPSWAAFNAASGQLSGTPAASAAGTYANIAISVSDGVKAASLPAFAIIVNQVSNGSATVNWTPPTANSDGTALTNLAGYRIEYGNATNALSNTIQVTGTGLTSYAISNLSPGTWYFGVVAYTASGAQSALSNVGSKTIN
jgi:Putative Ig domain